VIVYPQASKSTALYFCLFGMFIGKMSGIGRVVTAKSIETLMKLAAMVTPASLRHLSVASGG
jgi:hypothetical protein